MSLENSLLTISSKSKENIFKILDRARLFKAADEKGELASVLPKHNRNLVSFMVFSEPSTRTRVSFEVAGLRLGVKSIFFNVQDGNNSTVKGESWDETLLNLALMGPDLLIFRTNHWEGAERFASKVKFPMVNAGNGQVSHPSQSLIDLFVLEEVFGTDENALKDKNILFVGDVAHSRVARSTSVLAKAKGMNLGVCAPSKLSPEQDEHWQGFKNFESLDDSLGKADVVVLLRSQTERHKFDFLSSLSLAEYRSRYCMTEERVARLKEKSAILHPGPFLEGVDLDKSILKHPSCQIRNQVSSSIFVRMAIICDALGL